VTEGVREVALQKGTAHSKPSIERRGEGGEKKRRLKLKHKKERGKRVWGEQFNHNPENRPKARGASKREKEVRGRWAKANRSKCFSVNGSRKFLKYERKKGEKT